MSSNRQNLRWHGTFRKKLGNSLLTVWTIVKMNPHKKAVLARTKYAMNVDFVCWHELFSRISDKRLTTDRIACCFALMVLRR
jgi:hypothetical protein